MESDLKLDIRWRAFPLHPGTPVEGIRLEQLFQARPEEIQSMLQRLKAIADDLGLPFGDRQKTYNSRLAQELGYWAQSIGKGKAFHHAVFIAYFRDGKNIGDPQVLMDLVRSVGLPAEAAREVMTSRSFSQQVDADWALARQLVVTAVPTLVYDGKKLVGAQPYEKMVAFVTQGGGIT